MLESENSDLQKNKVSRMLYKKFKIDQHNGQRRYGPPKDWTGPPPAKGTEIYVTGLAKHYTEADVVPLFERVAKVYCLRIMMDFKGECRGFCYVRYTNPLDAVRAIKMFDGYQMETGVVLKAVMSSDNCRLFIGKIPCDLTKERLSEVFSKNTEGLMDVILYKSLYNKNLNRGYCFLEYDSHKSAALARRFFLTEGIDDFDFVFLVDWAVPEPEIDPHIFNKVTIMYVRNLMSITSENSIRLAISSFISPHFILRVKKVNDFAFVHFKNHEIADFAIKKFNGYVLDGAILEATWAKPTNHPKSAVGAPFLRKVPLAAPEMSPPILNDSDPKISNELSLVRPPLNYLYRKDKRRSNLEELSETSSYLLMIYPPSTALQIIVTHWYERVCSFNYFNHPNFISAQVVISNNDRVEFTWPIQNVYPATDSISARDIVSRAFFEHFILLMHPI